VPVSSTVLILRADSLSLSKTSVEREKKIATTLLKPVAQAIDIDFGFLSEISQCRVIKLFNQPLSNISSPLLKGP
jgi:hypothetical protein